MTTKTVSVKEAQAQFLELLDLVSMGNRVVIQKDEEPLAELLGISSPKKGKRVAGLNRGKMRMSDDFDAPLPDEFWLGEQ
ncbi:MAG: toxin-antitoxin (TA) system antitoxin [Candidatus Aminicenantes bacterium]|nr:toxin-antitoxin (TA) system antitoxin [Candidatus Aminicenantes bacterium]NIM79735.1 toxin-antitoxin (TA) system antitoxin [Candidatus Aminicenantes bacterium]NIN19066.1 toxin-antitoxin (TA) system antitoxin [Candidatus Aminicenantes bacterium]NIN42968.1 toxin-antitoxin (TA) system antitoxin [Candidatus Aminicenantes bacterium]NIN85711.1 toxin-antitoxin (TA) system antitoxin [Candidatus Aminicenantes bacterium]